MEMNIKNESLSVCSQVCRTKNTFTAECDVIVPDSKPDILKVLQLSARPKVTSCETKNGRVSVTGTITYNILYLADDEEKCIKAITSSCEFSNVVREDAISENMLTFVDVDVSELNCNVANCRKLTLKASLCMSLQVYSCYNLDLVSEIEGACIKSRQISSSTICAHAQSTSILTDSFPLASGKSPVKEILKTDGVITDSEIKIIDDKAILKGNLRITVLYKSELKTEYAQSEIPFAHIVEAEGIREDMNAEYCVRLCGIDASPSTNSDGQMCVIDFSADLYFRVIARCTYSAKCVVDAFKPHGKLECKHTPVASQYIDTTIKRNVDIREKITLPDSFPAISSVYQVVVRPFVENCSADGESLRTSGYAEVYILYLSDDESSPVYSYKTNVDFSSTCESPGCMITPVSDCTMKNMSYTISSDNCVEVRATLDVTVQCIRTCELEAVYDVSELEYVPEKRPGIIVSCVCSGRKLWDIAKEYCVHPDNILKANALESEDGITPHMALIIPK